MTARWDDAAPAFRRNRWLMDTMVLLSLDVTRAVATDLALEGALLVAAQPELRRILTPPFRERLADPAARFQAEQLLSLSEPPVQLLIRTFYDRVTRYAEAEPSALFCWGIVLTRCANSEAAWGSLGLPSRSSSALREGLLATLAWTDIQERLDAAFAKGLSPWDTQVAVLRLFPPPDEAAFGISDIPLSKSAKVVRKQGFWKMAAAHLGADGLRMLRVHAQAFLATQKDLAEAFGQLDDPWLLAHPELAITKMPEARET